MDSRNLLKKFTAFFVAFLALTSAIQARPHHAEPPIAQKSPLYWDWNQIDTSKLSFPPNFAWGVATSAHQVEGNCFNNDWADWEKTQSKTKTGLACDHWN